MGQNSLRVGALFEEKRSWIFHLLLYNYKIPNLSSEKLYVSRLFGLDSQHIQRAWTEYTYQRRGRGFAAPGIRRYAKAPYQLCSITHQYEQIYQTRTPHRTIRLQHNVTSQSRPYIYLLPSITRNNIPSTVHQYQMHKSNKILRLLQKA